MMGWRRIPKESAVQPVHGNYSDWKPILAEEAHYRCVYCGIHERSFGGTRNFHVEHFRPKSRFRKLTKYFRNLYYACAICNTFKGDDWPCEPGEPFDFPCYPDPSLIDYSGIFTSGSQGRLEGGSIAARYMIEKVFLNRPQLILERREDVWMERFSAVSESLCILMQQVVDSDCAWTRELLHEYVGLIGATNELWIHVRQTRPYDATDITRSS